MIRTIKLKLEKSEDLIQTIKMYNHACQDILDYGFEMKTSNKIQLHKGTYKLLRELYPTLPSMLIQTARDQTSDILKQDKFKHKIVKKTLSPIRYDNRTMKVFLESKRASLSTLFGRKEYTFILSNYYKQYINWEIMSAQLVIKKDICYLYVQVEWFDLESKLNHNDTRLGIDLGINNIVVCSDNSFYNSKHLKNVKGKYQYLKAELQSKGTRSAKRKLKKVSGRERRFVTDLNHCLSKNIVHKPYNTFVMEDLIGIRNQNCGKKFNKKLGNWSFGQLQTFINYKSEGLNKNVVYIKPQYTSQTCSKCGYVAKNNRNGNKFKCKKCNFQLDADLNASRNIVAFSKASSNWVSINHPIISSLMTDIKL